MPYALLSFPRFAQPTLSHLVRSVALASVLWAGSAQAQAVSLNTGVGINQALKPVLSLGLSLRNVSILGGFGLTTRLQGDIGPGGGLELSGLFDWPLDDLSDNLTLYGGPGVALSFTHIARLRPTVLIGLHYDLDGQLGLYGEGSYQFQGHFRVRAGATYFF